MASRKGTKKGQLFFHKDSKQKIMFGKWNTDGSAACLTQPQNSFLNLSLDDFENNYISYAEIEKKAKERRRTEGWKLN